MALIDVVNVIEKSIVEVVQKQMDIRLAVYVLRLNGFYINLEYQLANGQSVKFLDDNNVYLGNQIEIPDSDRCYGLAADDKYLLVCEYGCNGDNPQIITYKKR